MQAEIESRATVCAADTLDDSEEPTQSVVDYLDRLRGLEISIVTTAANDEESQRLLALLGMPFAR